MTNKRKYIRSRGCFPDTEQGWADYNKQCEEAERSMTRQHYEREAGLDIIDDMSIRERLVR